MTPEAADPQHAASTRRVALGIVARENVSEEVFFQWIHLLRAKWWPGPILRMRDLYVVEGRNGIANAFLDRDDCDDLLFIDSDHVPNLQLPEVLQAMPLEAEVVCGLYFGRPWPFDVQAFEEGIDQGTRFIHPRALTAMMDRPGLYPVGGGGTGCMLIRRAVLERMRDEKGPGRIFEAPMIPWEITERIQWSGGEYRPGGVWSEDIWFCHEAKQLLGVQTYLCTDPRMDTGHVGREIRDRRHWLAAHVVPGTPSEALERSLANSGHRLEVLDPPVPLNRAQRRELARRLPVNERAVGSVGGNLR